MKCPHCTETDLIMADRQGVEIDYCPNCRGVWLDRGELDKIIERSAQISSPVRVEEHGRGHNDLGHDDHQRKEHGHGGFGHDEHAHKEFGHQQGSRRHKSWLSEILG